VAHRTIGRTCAEARHATWQHPGDRDDSGGAGSRSASWCSSPSFQSGVWIGQPRSSISGSWTIGPSSSGLYPGQAHGLGRHVWRRGRIRSRWASTRWRPRSRVTATARRLAIPRQRPGSEHVAWTAVGNARKAAGARWDVTKKPSSA